MRGAVMPQAVAQLGIRSRTATHGGAHLMPRMLGDEMIEPHALGFQATAAAQGEILFVHLLGLEGLAALIGRLFILGGQKHAGGVLIESVNQKHLTRRCVETASLRIITALEGASLRFGGFGVRMREDAVGLVHHDDMPVLVEDRAGSDGGGGGHGQSIPSNADGGFAKSNQACPFQKTGWSEARLQVKWPMTATLTLDDQGRITLPEAIKRAFGIRPGAVLRAEVSRGRLQIEGDLPVITEGVLEDGMLVLPRMGMTMDAAAAIRRTKF